ncbi:hypothetical protein P7C70_g3594, partial [Phenoliferia sp. Uapishka_3]
PGAKLHSASGGYVFPMDAELPDIAVAIGNAMIPITKPTLSYGAPDAEKFMFGAIQSSGDSGLCIMGGPLFHNAYVIFDQGNLQVGVAERENMM